MYNSFFFSSRRRHTNSLCDWSSDVCSSDLMDATPTVEDTSDKTEEEVVKEFEAELDSLFDLLEWDVQ